MEDWTPITVHLTGEISKRNRDEPYKAGNFAAYPGDIVFSKIDARNGAIGLLPDEIGKAVVTSEFPVFVPIPERLDGEFVKLVLRTGSFIESLRRKASGTSGRKRVSPEDFKALSVPLPDLNEQRAIVAAYRDGIQKAQDLEAEANKIEADAVRVFEEALGFPPPTPLPDRPIFVATFKDIDRWSHEGILRGIVDGATEHKSPWSFVRLGDVIVDLENGWSPKCFDRPATDEEWGVLKLGAVSFGVFDQSENKALPPSLSPRPTLEIKSGQVLISRANITRLVGATALVGETRERLLLCDKIFRVVPKSPAPATNAFIAEVLRISDVRRQIESNVTGTSPTMKNISKPALLNLSFPLPPEEKQNELVKSLENARIASRLSREKAHEIRSEAWARFEAAVYAAEEPDTLTSGI